MSEHKYLNRGGTASMIVSSVCNEHRNYGLRADNAAILRAVSERFEFLESQRENLCAELKAAQAELNTWPITYISCPHCGCTHGTEGETQPTFCHGCHKAFTVADVLLANAEQIYQLTTELKRMRTALEEIEFATRDNDLFSLIHEVAKRALNTQPAQPEPK